MNDAIAFDQTTAELYRDSSESTQNEARKLLRKFLSAHSEKQQSDNPLNPLEADTLLREAAQMIVENNIGSMSMLQRRMKIGYNRAGRIMNELCQLEIVGHTKYDKPREVIVSSQEEMKAILDLFYS